MTDASASPHDQFFKELMTQPGVAGTFLRERLPQAVVALFTDSEPRLEAGSFVDPELRNQHSESPSGNGISPTAAANHSP